MAAPKLDSSGIANISFSYLNQISTLGRLGEREK